MDVAERADLAARHTSEVLTRDELRALFERETRPKAYIGFEPSGALTVAHLIPALKMRELEQAGCEVTVFVADWHAWINDKLGTSLERIAAAGRYMEQAFQALGLDPQRTRYRWASDLVDHRDYWSRVVRIAKATSLARAKRAMTILGRSEAEADLDAAKLLYPSMQAADIFELPVDIAYAGMDQRRAHVLAREVAHHYGWPVPVALHTPLLSSLRGGGRMDPSGVAVEKKMSKSDPKGAIRIPSDEATVVAGVDGAFCPAKEVEGNPVVEAVRYILFPWEGRLHVDRASRHGGPIGFETEERFLAEWRKGALHPSDLKAAVAAGLNRVLAPTRQFFATHPAALEFLETAGREPGLGTAA